MLNLPHPQQVFVQNSLTFFCDFPLSAFLHFLADFELFNTHNFPSFESHLFFSLVQVNFNFLQPGFFDITDGKLFGQPITKSIEYQKKHDKVTHESKFFCDDDNK